MKPKGVRVMDRLTGKVPEQVNFEATKKEQDTIKKIAKRAGELAKIAGVKYSLLDASMDITAVHLNGCPLKLNELLGAKRVDFAHDIWGIRNVLDRNTGKLVNFLPRYARAETRR